jgi:hypothetical protein
MEKSLSRPSGERVGPAPRDDPSPAVSGGVSRAARERVGARGGDCSSSCRCRRADQISQLVARELRRALVECFGRLCGAACSWTRPWCWSWCPGRVPSDAAELSERQRESNAPPHFPAAANCRLRPK